MIRAAKNESNFIFKFINSKKYIYKTKELPLNLPHLSLVRKITRT